MSENLKVSLLSAVYNEGRYIDEMIDSLQAQGYQNWEVVFVDDASTDDTVARIQARMADEPRIVLASHGTKLGKVGAFNKAYEASTGDLIGLLAGDDRCTLPDTMGLRARTHADLDQRKRAISFYKLRMFSEDASIDGTVVPKGDGTNQSGACMVLSRSLAEVAFPIDETLVAEDIWLRYAAVGQAEVRRDVPEVIMDYRVHANNSNPRRRPFPEMHEGMHTRFLAYHRLLESDRVPLTPEVRKELTALAHLEDLRYERKWLSILLDRGSRPVDRLAMASMAQPQLYALRNRFYAALSGLRGG